MMTPQEWVVVLLVSLGIFLVAGGRSLGGKIDRMLNRFLGRSDSNKKP